MGTSEAVVRRKTAKRNTKNANSNNGASLGFEAALWAAADKLRGHMYAAAYKHVMRVAPQAPDRKMVS